jgi:hypothetical protein
MRTTMYKKTYDNIFVSFSSTASFEGFGESTADSATLAEMMLYVSFPFNSMDFGDQIIKGHNLDTTLDKIMNKYGPALEKLAEL